MSVHQTRRLYARIHTLFADPMSGDTREARPDALSLLLRVRNPDESLQIRVPRLDLGDQIILDLGGRVSVQRGGGL